MENEWLKMNNKKLEQVQYKLTQLAFKNENPDVPIGLIRGYMGAMVVEIKRLQGVQNELIKELNELKEGLNKQ